MYRLKVNYRGRWKYSRVSYNTLEEAKGCQERLAAMGVKSKLCDAAGMEVKD